VAFRVPSEAAVLRTAIRSTKNGYSLMGIGRLRADAVTAGSSAAKARFVPHFAGRLPARIIAD
jgi:hypothetical protein